MDIELGEATISLPAVDAASLSQAARVDALVGLQRARAWVDACEVKLLAALAEPGQVPSRFAVSAAAQAKQYVREEIACALQVAPVTVNDKLHTARMLVSSFPATLAAVQDGLVTMRHARILVDGVEPLNAEARAAVQARVLGKAGSQTPTAFRRSVARAVLAVDPRGGRARHDEARAGRRVETRLLAEGMGSLHAVLPAAGSAGGA